MCVRGCASGVVRGGEVARCENLRCADGNGTSGDSLISQRTGMAG